MSDLKIEFDMSDDKQIVMRVLEQSKEMTRFLKTRCGEAFSAANNVDIGSRNFPQLTSGAPLRVWLRGDLTCGDNYTPSLEFDSRTARDRYAARIQAAFEELKEAFANRPIPPAEDFIVEF